MAVKTHPGVVGMDSSRSGLLSTLLMTLPLIIVPSIALLRPAGGPAGVAQTVAQGAQTPDDSPDDFFDGLDTSLDDAPEFRPDGSADAARTHQDADFEKLLPGSLAPGKTAESHVGSKAVPGEPDSIDPFSQLEGDQEWRPETGTEGSTPEQPAEPLIPPDTDATDKNIRQLEALGAIRTFWFVPGTTEEYGFAAFFRGETELVRYRFEATGKNRAACVDDVLQQVTQWRSQSARTGQRSN